MLSLVEFRNGGNIQNTRINQYRQLSLLIDSFNFIIYFLKTRISTTYNNAILSWLFQWENLGSPLREAVVSLEANHEINNNKREFKAYE